MNVSVGVLYSAQRLLDLLADAETSVDEILLSFSRIEVANARDVLDLSQRCRWLSLSLTGTLRLTDLGEKVVAAGTADQRLRCQLQDVVSELNPPWAKRLAHGRNEATKYFPDDIRQIFDEAGLLVDWDDILLSFWDELALAVRAQRNEANLRTGREAERQTILYETSRTKRLPMWLGRDTTFSGYDVLSVIDESDESPLLIEVKGTTLRPSEAYFFVSRHEWDTALTSNAYCFYLWVIRGTPELRVAKAKDVAAHVARDQGDGLWDVVKVPFKCFWH